MIRGTEEYASLFASLAGKARARKLSWRERREIAGKGWASAVGAHSPPGPLAESATSATS